jgi:hypothetical protein
MVAFLIVSWIVLIYASYKVSLRVLDKAGKM